MMYNYIYLSNNSNKQIIFKDMKYKAQYTLAMVYLFALFIAALIVAQ